MTVNLVFTTMQRKVVKFRIENRMVTYYDDNWKDGISIMPLENPQVRLQVKKMTLSRKPSVSAMGLLIADANAGKNREEYDKCQTDEEIAEVIRKDCTQKGLKEAK